MRHLGLRYAINVAALAGAYFALTYVTYSSMPYVSTPRSWLGLWPSRHDGVLAWFQLLNVAGALAAALPVALLTRWRISERRIPTAVLVGLPTAIYAISGYPCCSMPGRGWTPDLWVNEITIFLALLLSIPVILWLIGLAPLTTGSTATAAPVASGKTGEGR